MDQDKLRVNRDSHDGLLSDNLVKAEFGQDQSQSRHLKVDQE